MAQLPIGLNIEAIQCWTPTNVWADLAHQLMGEGGVTTPWNSAPVDADGWPTSSSGQTTLRSGSANQTGLPAGLHSISFESTAASGVACAITNCGAVTLTRSGAGPYTYTGTADYSGSGSLVFSYSGSPGGIRKLKVLLPGHTEADLLYSAFAAKARDFAALRFYQAMGEEGLGVNGHTDKFWSERRKPTFSTWAAYGAEGGATSKGIPWEAIILVCNKLGVDAWITLPYLTLGDTGVAGQGRGDGLASTDDYVTRVAQVFRYGSDGSNPYTSPQATPAYPPLAPGLNVYIEIGNELWNGATAYARDKNWNDAAAAAAGISSQRRIGRLVKRCADLWRTVWGGYNSRVRVVVPGQVGNAGWQQGAMDEIIAQGGTPLNQYVFGMAVAPYFDEGGSSVDDCIARMVTSRTDTVNDTVGRALNQDANLCANYGIKMLAYEGGIGNRTLEDSLAGYAIGAAVQADDRVRTQVLEPYLTSWFAKSSAGLFCYYTMIKEWGHSIAGGRGVGNNGFYGLSPTLGAAEGPKWLALRNVRGPGVTIGTVQYPTDTTWQVDVTGLPAGTTTFEVTDGTDTVTVDVTVVDPTVAVVGAGDGRAAGAAGLTVRKPIGGAATGQAAGAAPLRNVVPLGGQADGRAAGVGGVLAGGVAPHEAETVITAQAADGAAQEFGVAALLFVAEDGDTYGLRLDPAGVYGDPVVALAGRADGRGAGAVAISVLQLPTPRALGGRADGRAAAAGRMTGGEVAPMSSGRFHIWNGSGWV